MISKILLIQEVFPNQERGTTFSSISLVLVEVNVQFPGLICLYILQDMCVTCQSVHRVILYIFSSGCENTSSFVSNAFSKVWLANILVLVIDLRIILILKTSVGLSIVNEDLTFKRHCLGNMLSNLWLLHTLNDIIGQRTGGSNLLRSGKHQDGFLLKQQPLLDKALDSSFKQAQKVPFPELSSLSPKVFSSWSFYPLSGDHPWAWSALWLVRRDQAGHISHGWVEGPYGPVRSWDFQILCAHPWFRVSPQICM